MRLEGVIEAPLRHEGPVRVLFCGPSGSGKTCLIVAAATETFPERVPRVLPHTLLPASDMPDHIAMLLVDSSSRIEDRNALQAEVPLAECIVLTYAAESPASINDLRDVWLPELRRFGVKVPVIVVGCKLDLRAESSSMPDSILRPILELREAEACLECSARTSVQVQEVMYYAQKAVLHPISPLFDPKERMLQPACARALKRVFRLCDRDGDGVLSNAELNKFQLQCFGAPLSDEELAAVKAVVAEKLPEGVANDGLTLTGFMYLHALFIEHGRMETTWAVLRKFGYGPALRLAPEAFGGVSFSSSRSPDQCVELTERAVAFLEAAFDSADADGDGALSPAEVAVFFSTAPGDPQAELGWPQEAAAAAEAAPLGRRSFLANWALSALLRPQTALEYLLYAGFSEHHPSKALRVSRRRDRAVGRRGERSVVQALVLGPPCSGKATLLDGLMGGAPSSSAAADDPSVDRFAAALVSAGGAGGAGGAGAAGGAGRLTLVLRLMSSASAHRALEAPEALGASADALALFFECGSAQSLRQAAAQLCALAEAGSDVPVVVVAAGQGASGAEGDGGLGKDAAALCASVCIPPPLRMLPGSAESVDKVCRALVAAALAPEGHVPETVVAREARVRARALRQTLGYVGAAAAVIGTGVVIYKWVSSKRSTSDDS